MKKTLITFISLTSLISSVFAKTFPATAEQQNIQKLVDAIAKPFIEKNSIPGVAIAVYYNGHDYIFPYGLANKEKNIPVKADTIFELASITKVFTSSLLAYEVKQGTVKLNDKVVNYLPDLAATVDLPIDKVELVNLATHTSGFPRDVEDFEIPKGNEKLLIQSLETWHPQLTIGNDYLYSNVGFGLLGRVLERATGKDYYQLLNGIILQPLQMPNTFIIVPNTKQYLQAQGYNFKNLPVPHFVPNYLLGGGALRSTAADMLQFLKANLNIAVGSASPNLLTALQYSQQAFHNVRPNFVMGLGWQRINRQGNLYITKNGANIGFNSFIGFSNDKKFGVVVLANKKKAKAAKLGNKILNQLMALEAPN